MSSEAPQGSQPTTVTLPSTASYVGRDGEHDHHHYSAYHDQLWVVRSGGETISMGLDDLEDWIDYVDSRHGWVELRYNPDDPFAALAAEIEEAI